MVSNIADTDQGEDSPGKTDDYSRELLEMGLSEELLDSLGNSLASLRLSRFEAGDTIYRHGNVVEALHLVRHGCIKLMSYSPGGNARIVRLHWRGSVLGLNGLLDEKHDHTAIAVDDTELFILPMRAIRSIEGEDADAYYRLLEYSHDYLKEADTWITEFSSGNIRGRVARLVLYLMSQDDSTASRDVALLTVNEMAEIIGVTPESVSRILADFKRQGILSPVGEEADTYHCDDQALESEARS